jgi:hypothetical protein
VESSYYIERNAAADCHHWFEYWASRSSRETHAAMKRHVQIVPELLTIGRRNLESKLSGGAVNRRANAYRSSGADILVWIVRL